MTFYQVGAPAAQTDQSPAVALTDWPDGIPNSKVFVAWKKASSNTIWYSSSTDNIHWATPLQIQGYGWQALTDHGPALVLAEGFSGPPAVLYAAWKGDGGNQIWYSYTTDGVHWAHQQTVPGACTIAKPALGQNDTEGAMTVAWLAPGNSLYYVSSPGPGPNSSTWSQPAPLLQAGPSPFAPAVGSNSIYYLAVSWADDDNTLWYQLSGQPPARVTGEGFTSKTDKAPSLPTQMNFPGLAFKGNGDNSIWVVKEFPTPPMTQQRVTGASTSYAPAWAGVGFVLVFGADGLIVNNSEVPDNTIWTCIP